MTVAADLDSVVAALDDSAEAIARDFVNRHSADHPEHVCGPGEVELAARIVRFCAVALTDDDTELPDTSGFEEEGARAAARGRSASETIDWIRGLMEVVTDRFVTLSDGGVGEVRTGLGQISKVFDTLMARHLANYSDARDALGDWYTRAGTDLVSYLLSGAPIDKAMVNSQARALGLDPHQSFRAVAVLQVPTAGPRVWERVRRRLAAVFKRYNPQPSVLVLERSELLLAIVPVGADSTPLVEALSRFASDEDLAPVVYASIGEPASELTAAGRSCRQALSALEVSHYRGWHGEVTQCTEVILEVLLAHNHWVSQRIMTSRLGAIVDKPHLVETVRAYIDCDMSLQRTAERLYVHPNTVAYRLRQIATLTGRDMRKITDLAELTVAIAALDVIEMHHDQESGHLDLRARLLTDG